MIPIYILSIIINIFDFARVAEVAHPRRQGGNNGGGLEFVITEKLGSIGLRICLNIEMLILAQIPYIGWPISFIYGCWYWSFSCFEFVKF